jgi:hypothetical protein
MTEQATQQSETKPAVRDAQLPAQRARDPELDRLARIGTWLAASEAGGNDAKSRGMTAALRLFYAQELGLPPLAASELSIVRGRLFPHAKLLRALAARAGYRVERTPDSDDQRCTAVLLEHATGRELGRYTFTLEDAKRAKLVKDDSAWQTHPARMLWARACKFVLDDYAPEVTLGLGEEGELDELAPGPAPAQPAAGGGEDVEDADWTDVDEPAGPADTEGAAAAAGGPAAPPDPPADRESPEERKARLHRRLAVAIDSAETDARTLLPKGHDSWEGYSRWLAKERFGVESRADLDVDQLDELVRLVEEEAIPF